MPIPGDEIMGYHTAGKGIVVHRLDCPNVAEYRKSPERWVAIGWDREVTGDFHVALRIEVDEPARRAGAGRRRDRRRPNPTSTASNTSSATATSP